jgi:hypothetical protein
VTNETHHLHSPFIPAVPYRLCGDSHTHITTHTDARAYCNAYPHCHIYSHSDTARYRDADFNSNSSSYQHASAAADGNT